jgi:hypothetical protein
MGRVHYFHLRPSERDGDANRPLARSMRGECDRPSFVLTQYSNWDVSVFSLALALSLSFNRLFSYFSLLAFLDWITSISLAVLGTYFPRGQFSPLFLVFFSFLVQLSPSPKARLTFVTKFGSR